MINFIKKHIVSIIIIVLLLGGLAYLIHSTIKTQNEVIEARRQLQNAEAYKDSSEMKDSILQNYAVFVRNLQNENTKLNKQIIYMKSNFTLLLDSVKVLNQLAQSFNYGDSIIVKFEGKQGRLTYKGQTTYFTVQDSSTYSLLIDQGKIVIASYVYLDESNNLIYSRIYADSVLIADAHTEVDSALYNKLNKTSLLTINTPELNFFSKIAIYGEYIQPLNFTSETVKPSLNLGIKYVFDNNIEINGGRNFIHNIWYVGTRYSITPFSVANFIF
jgi:hypothetical protein